MSDFIKDALPYCMSENLKNTNILTEKELTHQIITETFIDVNNMLVSNENINSLFSGSTCVSVIYTPERLIVPNIGDSRAVLARYDKITKTYKAIKSLKHIKQSIYLVIINLRRKTNLNVYMKTTVEFSLLLKKEANSSGRKESG